jgi:hypothetical protein
VIRLLRLLLRIKGWFFAGAGAVCSLPGVCEVMVRCRFRWWFAGFAVCFAGFAGIRDLLLVYSRCPCAGRHLLFFAAAKKSRQKKAAQTGPLGTLCLNVPAQAAANGV